MAAGLTPFPKVDVYSEESSVGIRWKKYVAKLENLFVGHKLALAVAATTRKSRRGLLIIDQLFMFTCVC